jgi:hypothetical protein
MVLHLITICVGFIIAFGLQQTVELLQRRRRMRRQREAEAARAAAEELNPPA